jgi:hypothetical protein
MAVAIVNNAIGWAQFRLLGGWKNTLTVCGGYAVIFATVMFGFVRGVNQPASETFGYFAHIFLGLQPLALLLYGTLRLGGAVRADFRTRMIESHRLMPFNAGSAVFGYLLGAPIQAFSLFIVNYLLGAIAVVGTNLPMQWWTFANAMVLGFSFFVWSIVLFFSFRTSLAMWAGVAGLVIIPMSGVQILMVAPGASVLVGPMIGHTVFDPQSGSMIGWPYAISVAAQAIIAGLYLIAATKRYQRDDVIAFGPILSLLLLTAWVAVCVVGIMFWDEFKALEFQRDVFLDSGIVTSMTVAFLLAILPVSSGVRQAVSISSSKVSKVFLPWLMILAAAGIVLGMLYAVPRTKSKELSVLQTAVVVIAFLAGVRYVLAIALNTKLWPRFTLFGWLLLTWCVPLLIDVALQQIKPPIAADSGFLHVGDESRQSYGQIGMLSPVVYVYETWSRYRDVPVVGYAGLLGQCSFSLIMAIAYHLFFARRNSRAAIKLDSPAFPAAPKPVVPLLPR